MNTRFGIAALLAALSGPVAAEAPALGLELNRADTVEGTCQLTFVLHNTLGVDVDAFTAETVLFSTAGEVVLLTLFDFAALPAGTPRVRQFQVPGTACEDVRQVLINGVASCEIGGAASQACAQGLTLSSRATIALEG